MAKKGITEEQRKERLGTRCANISGYVSEIIEYNGVRDITVRFVDTGEIVKCEYRQWKLGRVKSNYQPNVFGVGITGKECELRDENGKVVRSYVSWKGMLERCYSENAWKSILRIDGVLFVKNGCIIQILKNGMMNIIMR